MNVKSELAMTAVLLICPSGEEQLMTAAGGQRPGADHRVL